jgi:hypothetical protein
VLTRRLLSVLLALAALLAAARPCAASEQEMTDEEAREARALMLRFMERLRETDDFGPLVKEFFPADFDLRLRQFVGEELRAEGSEEVLVNFDRALLKRAEPRELRRTYVAFMNYWNYSERIGVAAFDYARLECEAAGAKEPCGWRRHFKLAREAVPEEAYRLAAADPMLEAMLRSIVDESASREEEPDEEKAGPAVVRDPARMRAFNDGLEGCVVLLRDAFRKLRADARSYAAVRSVTESFEATVAERDELKVYHLSDETLTEASFGLPAGALLIRARVFPFEMAIARRDGRLTILAVYPDFDGD